MSYELRQDETVGDGIQRIVCHQIEGAIRASSAKQNGKGSPVHETRKHLKKARSALRLAAGEIDPDVWKREDRCLRKVGQLISEVRDAEVRLQTVRQLREFAEARSAAFERPKNFSPSSWIVFWRRFRNGPRKRNNG